MAICRALTKSGEQCKRTVPKDVDYCYQHGGAKKIRGKTGKSEFWEAVKEVAVVGAGTVAAIGTTYLLNKLFTETDGLSGNRPFDATNGASRTPESARSFAKELLNSGRKFVHVVEMVNPLNNDLSTEEEEDIKEAVADEVVKKLKADPNFKKDLAREVNDLRRTLPGNLLANAIVQAVAFLGL